MVYVGRVTRFLAFLSFFNQSPAVEPLPAERIQAVAAYSAAHGGHALLIKQNGKILHESYTNGHTKREPHRIYSGTKAFWCLTAFAAEKDGLFKLDDRVSDTITEWQERQAPQQDHRAAASRLQQRHGAAVRPA
jgi:CubicO group peptidase (beta-lactamase class C family)